MLHCASLLAGLTYVASALAVPVPAQRAAEVATSLLAGTRTLPAVESLEAVMPQSGGAPVLWLASFVDGGFAFIRGDDRLPPVAGWSEQGSAPWPIEHPALQDWLDLQRLDAEWSAAQQWVHPDAAAAWAELDEGQVRDAGRDFVNVAPMLTCTWDQGWPWNQYCPADAAGPHGHVWAGCVATAMAQIMYFWRWPETGAGSHSYTHPAYGVQTANFGATTYDWDNMQDATGTSAAALLQYHCGVAVNMQYAPDGSGAYIGTGNASALHAMESYFFFPPCAEFIQHSSFPGAAWSLRLSEEILAGRPVLDSGYGSGGHAFVLDGLQAPDLFHLNWGWSGWYNGWFAIEALTPGGMEFSIMQGAIVNLMPNTAPQVLVPDQTVFPGQAFTPIQLDLWVQDGEDEVEQLSWWCEENGPLSVAINQSTRTALVNAPAEWTGGADISFCAMDPLGFWSCAPATFTVTETVLVPAAVGDLHLVCVPPTLRLEWTAPSTDASGQYPAQIGGYDVHTSANPWFEPDSTTLMDHLPAEATSWIDPAGTAGRTFYRVVVTTPQP